MPLRRLHGVAQAMPQPGRHDLGQGGYECVTRPEVVVGGAGADTDPRRCLKGLSPAVAAELEGVELVDPDLVYEGGAEIDLGGRTVLLREVGPAHTRSDQIVLVDGRVLFAGDLLETRIFPIAPYFPPHDTDVDGEGSIGVLDRLAALAPRTVVPGHGEVTDASLIHDVRDYLVYVRDEALRLRERGATADETAATVDENARARRPSWERPEWTGLTARAFYDTGAPV
ncbi:MBL fold metallo-hydrolase [Streptomyces katrae]|uniref:MBL fold metallo-hydrolase n=1 Tax=Streptomyces katrae TaxID=68223 RepID=A0ABT7GNQ3_9ACTN|nr:MBL fold metallo-hydrolase [Streptomyces katrae]MDK9495218.1 MBL fold metallo-hydrolase [Streptomyces katrae]